MLVLGVLGALFAAAAQADDARPASLAVQERADHVLDVRWQTPMRGSATLRLAPRLPEGSHAIDGSYDRRVAGDTLVETWQMKLPGGLAGRRMSIDGLALSTRSVIVEVRLRAGPVHRAVLSATRQAFVVPELAGFEDPDVLELAPATLRAGFRATLGSFAHVLFALLLVFAGGRRAWAFGLAGFLAADLVGRAVDLRGVPEAAGLALLALAGVVFAREIRLGRARRIVTLAALAGLAHGLAVGAAPVPLETIADAAGTDAGLLTLGGLALLASAVLPRFAVRLLATAGGVLGIAAAIVLAVAPPATAVAVAGPPISPMAFVTNDAASPGVPTTVEGITAVLDVAVFETRVELLGRLPALDRWLGLGLHVPVIPVAGQDDVLAQVRSGIKKRIALEIDGAPFEVELRRAGFIERDAAGVYLRDTPVPETLADAVIGVALVRPTEAIPRGARVTLAGLPADIALRGRIIDPEVSRDAPLSAARPVLDWTNALEADPLPPIEAVLVRRRAFRLPVASLFLVGLGVFAAMRAARRGRRQRAALMWQALLVASLLVAPLAIVDVPALAGTPTTPAPREARAIASTLLDNLYRAFNERGEHEVYDRLALSLEGSQLARAYVENRKTLEVEKSGGAQARVDIVELLSLDHFTPLDGGGFNSDATWSVTGSVTHFGHRHLRQNRYEARLEIAPTSGSWKIRAFDLRLTERTK